MAKMSAGDVLLVGWCRMQSGLPQSFGLSGAENGTYGEAR